MPRTKPTGGRSEDAERDALEAEGVLDPESGVAIGDVEKTPAGMVVAEEEDDPAMMRARARADAMMDKLRWYADLEALKAGLAETFVSDEKLALCIDAPTSKPKVLSNLLEKADAVLAARSVRRWCALIPCGRRLDLVVVVCNKASVVWPQSYSYTVQLNSGQMQSTKRRPSYLVVVASKYFSDADAMPSIINVSNRAQTVERTRMRCLDRSCPLRSLE